VHDYDVMIWLVAPGQLPAVAAFDGARHDEIELKTIHDDVCSSVSELGCSAKKQGRFGLVLFRLVHGPPIGIKSLPRITRMNADNTFFIRVDPRDLREKIRLVPASEWRTGTIHE